MSVPTPRPGFLGILLGWAPVWAGLVLFAQVSWLGLRPAIREGHELDWKAEWMDARIATCRAELRALDAWLVAQDDPIYRERVRRLALDPGPAFDPWAR